MKVTTLIKFGGSLITDKQRVRSFRRGVLRDLLRQLAHVREQSPQRRMVIGHGSGSFGHHEAQQANIKAGLQSPADILGFARVGAAASELSMLVLAEMLALDLPALRFPPSAMFIGRQHRCIHFDTEPLLLALQQGLLPLLHGDVVLDRSIGGYILSTEALFAQCIEPLDVQRIILLGEVDGVLGARGELLPRICPQEYPRIAAELGGAAGVDVTGGMRQKVQAMLALAQRYPTLEIVIANGLQADILLDLLLRGRARGTRIHGDS